MSIFGHFRFVVNMSTLPKISIAPGKRIFFFQNQKILIFFLFLHGNVCCGYSLEAIRRGGASNGYSEQKFSWRKKNIYIY